MASKYLSILLILSLLFISLSHHTLSLSEQEEEEEEDISFLIDDEEDATSSSDPDPLHHYSGEDGDFDPDNFENYDEDADVDHDHEHFEESEDAEVAPEFDEKDVVVLGGSNFTDFIHKNKYVMVEFYAPWCGHCQSLAPEYAAAATEVKTAVEAVVLAKVDATEESQLAQEYEIQGFPTVLFFVDGVKKEYPGERTKDAIVTWIKKKSGPGIYNLTTVEEAERVLTAESKVVLGFLDSLVGAYSDELAAASRLEDDVSFYQTSSAEVAKLFHLDSKAKRPSLVLLKKEAEKISLFDGEFTKSTIAQFVTENKLPLVTNFTRESAPLIFENPIKKQLLLFATANDTAKYLTAFEEASKSKAFKGKLIFVFVEMDNEDIGRPVSEYFGVSGDAPRVIGYTGNDDAKKFVLDGELTLSSIKSFGGDFLEDKLKPFYKSDPIPETNDGDVKIVVGNNFDEIVLDESKDVLLEIYAPWCGHCQSLEPIYNKLAKHLKSIDSIVISKMDGTTNEHPRAKADGFPTLLFFPAGNKSSDPIPVDSDRTVVAFYKFLKKNASISFKLQKPASTEKSKESDTTESRKSDDDSNLKDEL